MSEPSVPPLDALLPHLDAIRSSVDAVKLHIDAAADARAEDVAFISSALQTLTEGFELLNARVNAGRDTAEDIRTALENTTSLLLALKEPIAALTSDETKTARESLTASADSIASAASRLDALAVDLLSRLEQIPAQVVDPKEVARLETAREAIYSALNDVIAVAQLKQKVIDRAGENRFPWYIPVLSMGFGAVAAAAAVLLILPGVDTNAEAWGRHLLADKAFAACLNQSQAPNGPAACSIRFRPDPAPAAAPQKR